MPLDLYPEVLSDFYLLFSLGNPGVSIDTEVDAVLNFARNDAALRKRFDAVNMSTSLYQDGVHIENVRFARVIKKYYVVHTM